MNTLELSAETLFYATRYALSRNTAASMQVADDIARVAGQLSEHNRKQLAKEIKDGTTRYGNAMAGLNREDWQRAIAALEAAQ